MNHYNVRPATVDDKQGIFELYVNVSGKIGGLARTSEEITYDYINSFTSKALGSGLQFIVENLHDGSIVGEIHCYKPEPKVFNHILSELTIAVHPDFQSIGLGKMLFQCLLKTVRERRDILRVELIARESNQKAITFYQKLGFQIEGRLLNRIKGETGFEADIPMAWMNDSYEL
ncbi:MAG TPA: N-acetyltransferase [Flavisolibacter sp.]|jgi:ribosomal protein S18 acetylase RimI-like enzyme|nr:N-acetyltransferase [Flavisolibacter sp.]